MADQNDLGNGFSIVAPSNPQGSDTQQTSQNGDLGGGYSIVGSPAHVASTKSDAPVGDNHPLAQEVEGKARQLQQLIENAPKQAEDKIYALIKSHVPDSFGRAIDAYRNTVGQIPGTGDVLAGAISGIPQAVKGAAEVAQGNNVRGAANVGLGVLNALPLLPGAASKVVDSAIETGAGAAGKAGSLISQGLQKAKTAFSPTLESFTPEEKVALPPGLSQKFMDTLKPVPVPHPSEIQPEFQQGLKDIFDTVTRQHGGIPIANGGLSDSLNGAVDALDSQADTLYKRIDAAMGGTRFQTLHKEVKDLARDLVNATQEKIPAIRAALEDKEETLKLYWERAARNGNVTPADADMAQNLHRRFRSMQEVQSTLQGSLKAARDGYIGVPDKTGIDKYIDPRGFSDKLEALERKDKFGGQRVSTALGDQADRLFQHVSDYYQAARQMAIDGKVAKATNEQNKAALNSYITSVQNEYNRVAKMNARTVSNNIAERTRVEAANAAEKARVTKNRLWATGAALAAAGADKLAGGVKNVEKLAGMTQ